MADRNDAALQFLATRRSVPPKAIAAPAPDRAEVERLLTIAARVPDHGMLTPWRFVVLGEPALRRVAAEIAARAAALGLDEAQIAKGRAVYDTSPLAVVVVAAPVASDKIPDVEQSHSAAAVCLSLLNAALAAGWAAGWVTGWAAHERPYLPAILGLNGAETVAGVVHIGTAAVPPDRPRPDVAALTTWAAG
jgi:nitroreductase